MSLAPTLATRELTNAFHCVKNSSVLHMLTNLQAHRQVSAALPSSQKNRLQHGYACEWQQRSQFLLSKRQQHLDFQL